MTPAYLHLRPGTALPSIPLPAPFRAVVIDELGAPPTWQAAVSTWLVEGGCRYMLAWGPGSTTWDDAVDFANLERFDFGDLPEDEFVMTTWHDDEPLAETLSFCKNTAPHPCLALDHTLLLHVAESPRQAAVIEAYPAA